MNLFTIFILSLFLTIALVPVLKSVAFRIHLVDVPDQRKVHVLPMPRSGGIAMALGAIVPVLLWVPMDGVVRAVHIGCTLIVVFGVVDDVRNLRYVQKFLVQIAGALVVIFYGGIRIEYLGNLVPAGFVLPFFVSVVLTLVFIVGVTNAINLSDGLDGLAGGISMLSFVTIGFFAYQCENMTIAMMSIAVVGAILGFLRYNTHPAMVFMGDAGSQMLGFLSVVFTLVLTQCNTAYSQVTPLFLIGFPILDTLVVMVERISKGGSPFKPDKNHFHHKLMKLGLFHSESVFVIYLLQALFICSAFVFRFYSNGSNLVVFVVLAGTIVVLFEAARQGDFKFRNGRESLLGSRSVLATFAGDRLSIRFLFAMLKWGLAFGFLFQCMIPGQMPQYMSYGAVLFCILILGANVFKPQIRKDVLRVALYCTIPLVLYFSTMGASAWMTKRMVLANNAAFLGLVLFVIMTLNLTRRQKGFKVNPLDFLVVIVIIVFPNLPSMHLENPLIKLVVAKILILFFSYDVLLGELRAEDTFLDKSLLAALFVIVLKGFV
ncbi:MAG: undecaprenyl/decaprenyl-phosphate alpha-N-acetylglucosaminyl 1-phosphate transferase [Deltaproteobacteria bacterium]|uniref:glycosyltransferase family 4 protein n=1 Tax=Desulfobacula sp. TaxID=2593537 RepID=UPI0019A0A01F|nr:undecaprenyl/decaprenyl-phosphate alpha-N-acetylglucosaminyl 1-phosphate transferase [Candidatus Desulfobacula maris]MBL6992403.1 undecaprenyl/decaprenyl-phosphate alpha-N-acetylglucosaminyl 1-phosphate transferase [Desulfobacula sp.]